MPFAALKPCAAGCGKLVRGRPRCDECESRRKTRVARADLRRRGTHTQRGYDADWERLRKAHLAEHPDCVKCGNPANTVDHVVAWQTGETEEDRQRMRLDPDNLVSMCRSDHSRKTVMVDGGFGRQRA